MSSRTTGHNLVKAGAITLLASTFQVAAPAWGSQAIEEVVVTARKRAESAQDVPAAVAAFNAAELQDRGITNITEVARLTPNITINETNGLINGSIQVFIRGIGNDPGFDQGVGIYVDDVYMNRTAGALLEVYDIERIEVLKGPQGHLYGRNTIGGAVKYVSREPDGETRFNTSVGIGTDDLRKVQLGASGALVEDRLFGSFAMSYSGMDGWQTNLFDGSEWSSKDMFSARGSLVFQATDNLKFKLVADLYSDDSSPYIPTRVAVQQGGAGGLGTFEQLLSLGNLFVPGAGFLQPGETLDASVPTDEDHVNTSFVGRNGFDAFKIESKSLALTATWDVNDRWSVKSITSGRWLENNMPFDFDGSPQRYIDTLQQRDQTDISQEIQVNFTGDNINAVFGAYYLDGEFENQTFTAQTPFLRLLTSHEKRVRQDDRNLKSMSIYGNVDWDINDQWQLSIGGRFTKDEKDLDQLGEVTLTQHPVAFLNLPGLEQAPVVLSPLGAQVFPNLPFFNFFLPHFDNAGNFIGAGNTTTVTTFDENKVGDDEWSEFTPSVRVRYTVSDDVMVYAGISTGFKSGGFDTTGAALQANSYEPETVTTYALGVKSTLAEGSLRVNAELFQNDYTDKQFAVISLVGGSLNQTSANVGEVTSRGGELEITWLPPVDGLAVNLNVGYLDVEVDKFIDQIPGSNPPVLGDISNDRALGYAPEWTVQARVQYTAQLGNAGSLTIGVDADYRDEMYTDSPINLTDAFLSQAVSDSRTLTNAFITYRSADQRWRVMLEGKNLSDKRVLENTFNVTNFILGGYNRGRTWGLTVGYDFE